MTEKSTLQTHQNSHQGSRQTQPATIGLIQLWRREWQVKQQSKVQWLYPLVLFLLIITLFPLSMGTQPELLASMAVPAVWIACLLSLVMGIEDLFRPDFDNGVLAQLTVAQASLPLWVLIRLIIHWLFSAGMLAMLSFLTVPMFDLSWGEAGILSISIILGSPILLLLSTVASALTLSLKNGAVLVPLLALPLQLPVLIFATGAVDLYVTGMSCLPILALLLAGSIISVLTLPWVVAYILRMAWLS